jgi:hypothetical protein
MSQLPLTPGRAGPKEKAMSRRVWTRTAVVLGAAALAFLLVPAFWDRTADAQVPGRLPPGVKGAPVERWPVGEAETAETLRRRLAYEAKHGKVKPELTKETEGQLNNFESLLFRDYRVIGMQLAARELHDKSVQEFVGAEGFGMERMVIFVPKYLEIPNAPPIKLAKDESFSEADAGDPVKLPRDDSVANPLRVPTAGALLAFHTDGQRSFVNLPGFAFLPGTPQAGRGGFARPRVPGQDRKAKLKMGFWPHHFRHVPDVPRTVRKDEKVPEKEKWLVQRIELVSLLKHEQPVAYVSKHLPRMDELRKAETRPLDGFEMTALASLKKGETIVSDASVNRMYLLGAVRAATQCLDCHSVERGTLLGAFSYELVRTPRRAPLPGRRDSLAAGALRGYPP